MWKWIKWRWQEWRALRRDLTWKPPTETYEEIMANLAAERARHLELERWGFEFAKQRAIDELREMRDEA